MVENVPNISYESAIGYFFAILGVFVTLISVTAALNQEIRQKLLVRYFSRVWWIQSYVYLVFMGFLIASFSLLIDLPNMREVIIGMVFLLFLLSLIFVIVFIRKLNREYFYKLLLQRIEKKLRKEDNIYRVEPFNDFVSNVGYVLRRNMDLEDEQVAFKKLVDITIKHNQTPYLVGMLRDLRQARSDLFNTFLQALYDLRAEKTPTFKEALIYQHLLVQIIRSAFAETRVFDAKLNTSGLYIKEFFDIRLLDKFKSTASEEEINDFVHLAKHTIDSLYQLCMLIVDLQLPSDTKETYLLTQLGELNKAMEYYNHLSEIDFCPQYYDWKFKDEHPDAVKLAEKKLSIVGQLHQYVQEKKAQAFDITLQKIDTGDLASGFFELALKIYRSKGFKEQFYRTSFIDTLSSLQYDWFEGGAQSMAAFNFAKYKLLMLLYDFKKDPESVSQFQNLQKEHFNDTASPFESALNEMDMEFVAKYFTIEEKQMKIFSKKILAELKKRLKDLEIQEKKYHRESAAKAEYVKTFKEDVKKIWTENQEKLKEFLKINTKSGGEKLMVTFGQYKLHEKEWFLESFYNNVSKARDAGRWYGRDQIISKNKHIIESFVEKQLTHDDEVKLSKSKFVADLKKILKGKKTYYFVFDSREFEIYSIEGLNWKRSDLILAELPVGQAKLQFLSLHAQGKNILFEKGAIILDQYEKGFENNKEEIFVDVEGNFTTDEQKKLIEAPDNKINSKDDINEYVKIRISEKFQIRRDNKKQAYQVELI